jgi:hypothetical protein
MPAPIILAMLYPQDIAGDETLLRLTQVRFQEAGLGAELYPDTLDQLRQHLAFCPAGLPCTAHIPRDINLVEPEGLARLLGYAEAAAGQLYGLVVHDHRTFMDRPDRAQAAFREADRRLAQVRYSPRLFVEYACALPLDCYAELFERTADLERVSACIDISHVGIHICQDRFGQPFPVMDRFSRQSASALSRDIEVIQRVVAEARPAVVSLVQRLARLGKPLHFHLHDGHPLSTLSRWGVSDHLSFLQQIRLPCPYRGRELVGGIFGPSGLSEIIRTARQDLPLHQLTFMIEVHPQEGRTPLGVHAPLFAHWREQTNAERMNYWLEMLLQNAYLLRETCFN